MDIREIETRFKREADIYCPDRYRYIPCFDDFFLRTTNFIASTQIPPKRVLELGGGVPVLSALYRQYFPDAQYVLIDHDVNLGIARKWFKDARNVEFFAGDYSKELPEGKFDLIISELSIHHLPDETKRRLFCRIYDALPEGALFANYDQFSASYGFMDAWQNGYWETQLLESGLSEEQIALWRHRLGADRECTVAEELRMMRDAGFQAVCNLYTNLKFSVLTCVH